MMAGPVGRDAALAAAILDQAPDAMLLIDARGRIIDANRRTAALLGIRRAQVLGTMLVRLAATSEDRHILMRIWSSVRQTGHWSGILWHRPKELDRIPLWASVTRIKDQSSHRPHYLVVLRDGQIQEGDQERLRGMALIDPLTGLPNRLLFLDRMEATCRHTQRSGGLAALFFVDLDRFKWINDTLGHQAGDLVLQETARRLENGVRHSDTVARLGGDEFTVILSPIAEEGDVAPIARAMLARLGAPIQLPSGMVQVSGCIGIALLPRDGCSVEEVMRRADMAMYEAKNHGRNGIYFFCEELNARAEHRAKLELQLIQALERHEFKVVFQPIVDLNTGDVAGAEALLRWQHPTLGLLGPDSFIAAAEECGQIIPMGRWILEEAIRCLAAWHDAGFTNLRVSVNISRKQLRTPEIFMTLFQRMTQLGVPPKSLEIEISEDYLREDSPATKESLAALSRFGIGLAIDDFGTGQTSFRLLRKFAVRSLRIDRIFLRNIQNGEDDIVLMGAMIATAHSLGMPIVGEGVESRDQLNLLSRRGCDFAQGFYLSRPLDGGEFLSYLRNSARLAATGRWPVAAACLQEEEAPTGR